MDRRTLLAAVAATAFSTAALTGAVAATTQLFAAGEAAAGVGTISPVPTPTLPPIVEHKVLDVTDPAPAAPPPAPSTPSAPRNLTAGARVESPPTTAAPAVTPTVPSVDHDEHEDGDEHEYEPGDD